jgi:hypothetical protein
MAERQALECGGRLHFVSYYALSLLMLDWFITHAPFA